MSLRIKFLALLVVIPSFCLGIFLYFAMSVFISDKKSYLLENQFQFLNTANLFLDQISVGGGVDSLKIKIENLKKQEGFESLVAVDPTGKSILDPNQSLQSIFGSTISEKLTSQNAGEGSFEAVDQNGERRLVSFLQIKNDQPAILILNSISQGATRASTLFLLKSLSVFLALISMAVIISLLFSNRLTAGIRSLSLAMQEFGQGKFDSPLPTFSQDEVGSMSRQFDLMRKQIKTLIRDKEEKTKIETEMRLAGELQKSFLPESVFVSPQIEFSGYYEPAEDAGGDWWFYFLNGHEFIFLIGDVTGHGLKSAMLTGAARSALSLISEDFRGPGEAMRKLNKVIFEAAGGKLNMTCCIASLDLHSGKVIFSNASHDDPIMIPSIDQDLKRKDFEFLSGNNGPRLGESLDSTFPESSHQLNDGDALFLFTDGLLDLQNPDKEIFSERNLLKHLGKDHGRHLSGSEILNKIKIKALQFRSGAKLADDLSFFAVKWRKS